MRHRKIIKVLGLVLIFSCAISSCKKNDTLFSGGQETQNVIDISNQTTRMPSESRPVINQEDLVIERLEFDETNTRVNGKISELIEIDASLLVTVDPLSPGSASSYTAIYRSFSEPQRMMFVQPGWSLIESEFRPAFGEYDDEYLDVYEDSTGQIHYCNVLSESASYYTPVGNLIWQIEVPPKYYSQTDFDFMTEPEAFELAHNYLESFGYEIHDYHLTSRLSYEELEISSRLMDQTIVEKALPQGWTSEQDAYRFTLFVNIDGLPMISNAFVPLSEEYDVQIGTVCEVIVTPKGIEYVDIFFQYTDAESQSSAEMINIEEALVQLAQYLYPNYEELIVPVKVVDIQLGYLGQWKPSTGEVLLRPFWVINTEQESVGLSGYSAQIIYYVDALSMQITDEFTYAGDEI